MAENVFASPETSSSRALDRSRHTRWLFPAGVGVLYLCLGLIAYGPSLSGIDHRPFSVLGDFNLFIWFLAWPPHAALHGLNPFFSNGSVGLIFPDKITPRIANGNDEQQNDLNRDRSNETLGTMREAWRHA